MNVEAPTRRGPLVVALLLAAGVAVALGVYGRAHVGSYESLPALGFSTAGTFKAWATTVVLLLALTQLVTALWMYGRLPGSPRVPAGLGTFHRVTGAVAFVLSLPVAAFCLYGFGFAPEPFATRSLLHSLTGCALYGAFAAKVLLVHSRRIPGWALPVVGSTLFTAIVLLWLTGSLWFFDIEGVHL